MIVKHTNPCGVASKDDLLEAYRLAVRADPVSAFGGIVAFNRVVDEKLAKEIREFRCVGVGEGAVECLAVAQVGAVKDAIVVRFRRGSVRMGGVPRKGGRECWVRSGDCFQPT